MQCQLLNQPLKLPNPRPSSPVNGLRTDAEEGLYMFGLVSSRPRLQNL